MTQLAWQEEEQVLTKGGSIRRWRADEPYFDASGSPSISLSYGPSISAGGVVFEISVTITQPSGVIEIFSSGMSISAPVSRVIDGFLVEVEYRDNRVFLSSSDLDLVACASSLNDAMDEFRSLLVDYFDSLSERVNNLAPNLREHYELLKSKLGHKHGDE